MKILENGIAVIEGDSHISKWVEQSGRLDHDQNMLPRILPLIKPGDVVVDAGAFIGDHTIAYSRDVGSEGEVLAFEPNPKAYECLLHNMKGLDNVHCHPMGLGRSKSSQMVQEAVNAGASYLSNAEEGGSVIVFTITLDEVISRLQLSRVNFIKIDCEGFEVDILAGAEQTIKTDKPVMVIEINPGALKRREQSPADIFRFLTDHGYAYSNIYPGQPMEGNQYDILCLPKGFVI